MKKLMVASVTSMMLLSPVLSVSKMEASAATKTSTLQKNQDNMLGSIEKMSQSINNLVNSSNTYGNHPDLWTKSAAQKLKTLNEYIDRYNSYTNELIARGNYNASTAHLKKMDKVEKQLEETMKNIDGQMDDITYSIDLLEKTASQTKKLNTLSVKKKIVKGTAKHLNALRKSLKSFKGQLKTTSNWWKNTVIPTIKNPYKKDCLDVVTTKGIGCAKAEEWKY